MSKPLPISQLRPIFLTGDRVLKLVPLRQEDVPLALQFIQEAGEWAPRTAFNTDPLAVLGATNATWLTALMEDEVIGIAGAHAISMPDRSAELALGVVPKYRRKGVGVILARLLFDYCFKTLNLLRLTISTPEGSPASHIAVTCGMVLEGRHISARFKDGVWLDTLDFALLREG